MTAPVTVETLTDADIQSILDEGLDPNVPEDREIAAVIKSARNPLCHPPRLAEARRRICSWINARRKAKLAANREDEPCPDGECKHVHDNWPAGSVTERDRSYDQCPACGWTETEVAARDASREAKP